ncbi:MAG TPA: AAA family ATPase [Myxococcales bacterium LLY-WYZ-16_1]|jgi:MoxR-like ATPase|nr:AAA family ATPase [Myxococcales bacterium LLY-WYZ-16_1]
MTEAPSAVASLPVERVVRDVSQVLKGKDDVVRLCLIGILARGHILLEDVPGVGKTTLARALARILGGTFARVQMTADLLPADIVGGPVLDKKQGELVFRPGPIFSNVVLADELNRATPRTQSGLLEAMAERSVSVDGKSHPLPSPFFVLATQNPSDHHGAYRLPQSQLDRFLLRTHLGYPDADTEMAMLMAADAPPTEEVLQPLLQQAQLAELHAAVDRVRVSTEVAAYLHQVVEATRASGDFEIGVSTRGMLAFARAARARALVEGRTYVVPDDVYEMAVPACAHRVVVSGDGERETAEGLLRACLEQVEPPS